MYPHRFLLLRRGGAGQKDAAASFHGNTEPPGAARFAPIWQYRGHAGFNHRRPGTGIFLVDQALYNQREDLILTGRTLYGARSPKGQELEDHYFGAIKPRVKAFMEDLNDELWKLGVLAKTEHNEVAPAQHELAPIFTTSNIASDHNQLTMEILKKSGLPARFGVPSA